MELNNREKLALLNNFEIDFEYGEVTLLDNFDYFLIFNKERFSRNTDFVAKVYDKAGTYVLTIPFPEVEMHYQKLKLIFSWCWEVERGVRIVFNADDRIMWDFWYEFDLINRKYTNCNRAY